MKQLNKKPLSLTINILAIIGFVSLIVLLSSVYKFHFSNDPIHEDKNSKNESVIHSQYTGQEERGIKALSQDDIDGLLAGAGTPFGGMAKAAELNGFPGPRHVLDAFKAGEFKLESDQYEKIETLYEEMNFEAIKLGKEIIDIEKEIDQAFREKTITEEFLQKNTSKSASLYAKLRFVHLKYHLSMVTILTPKQVAQYNNLRGYTSGDPCKNIPKGHDAKLWKMHNGC